MQRIIECVPNFSEGRKSEVVAELASVIDAVAQVAVLDVHMDADHNRSVITFAGAPDAVLAAAVRVVARAVHLIDLREHAGVHPRLGATDVLPFVPIKGVTMDECVRLAHAAGERIWRETSVPVYFYEHAAHEGKARRLEHVRRGGYDERRAEALRGIEHVPDIGANLHESAGAVIVGARAFLIAFNINLRTDDVHLAKRIARAVRESGGGLPHVKALGLKLGSRDIVQVSMNLTNYQVTSPEKVFRAVEREAHEAGIAIEHSEIVGLVPQAALPADITALKIANFSPDTIFENRLEKMLGE